MIWCENGYSCDRTTGAAADNYAHTLWLGYLHSETQTNLLQKTATEESKKRRIKRIRIRIKNKKTDNCIHLNKISFIDIYNHNYGKKDDVMIFYQFALVV